MAHLDSGRAPEERPARDVPQTNTGLLVAAGICLLIPVVALCWVSTYARETPRLGGVPFFFWYQFLWVFLTAGLTYAAHRLVIAARKPGRSGSAPAGRHADPRGGDQ